MTDPVLSMSRVSCPHTALRVEHGHAWHELFLSLNGSGSQFVRGREFPMRAGDLFLFPPGMTHLCGASRPGKMAESYVVWAHEDVFAEDTRADRETRKALECLTELVQRESPCLRPRPSTVAAMRGAFRAGEPFFPARGGGSLGGMKSVVQMVVHLLVSDPVIAARLPADRAPAAQAQRIGPVLQHIEQNYMRPVTVDEVARILHVSRSHFHALFREAAGMTFVDYLIRFRVRVAARLLRETDMTILDIADACGFPNLSHFYQCFRRLEGRAPRQFRLETGGGSARA